MNSRKQGGLRSLCRYCLLAIFLGCDPSGGGVDTADQTESGVAEGGSAQEPRIYELPSEQLAPPIKQRSLGNDSSDSSGVRRSLDESDAVERVFAAIEDAAEVGPVTVVWIWDVSTDARSFNEPLSRLVQQAYGTITPETKSRLQSAIISYSDERQPLVEEPTDSLDQIQEAFASLEFASTKTNQTFAAIQQTVVDYESIRRRERKQLIFICCTNEKGDDLSLLEVAVETLRSAAAPLFVLGPPAPFGRVGIEESGMSEDAQGGWRVGPETAVEERLQLDFPTTANESEWMESGYGAWGLERLARQSGGRYLLLRELGVPPVEKLNRPDWPRRSARRFSAEKMAQYKPDYRAEQEIVAELKDSSMRAALVAAANLPRTEVLANVTFQFDARDTARMVNSITRAQREPARVLPGLEQMLETLEAGVVARENEQDPRWQAAFDLALGRALAAHSRADGYNALLAELKRGKSFRSDGDDTWELVPSDAFESGGSTLKTNAKRAEELLTKVQREHAGTPWAYLAEQELSSPLAWRWNAIDRHDDE